MEPSLSPKQSAPPDKSHDGPLQPLPSPQIRVNVQPQLQPQPVSVIHVQPLQALPPSVHIQAQPVEAPLVYTPANVHTYECRVKAAPSFREMPVRCVCQNCRTTIVTSTSYKAGSFAAIICLVLAFMGFWIGCCLIPFCMDGCKDVIHHCPNCGSHIGTFRKM